MTVAALELEGVTKSFKKNIVLNNIDLAVEKGRVVGLLGKNGAGKTTLIKCAMGLLRVSSGLSKVFGEESWNIRSEAKARIGYVPQEVELFNFMSVRQMIAYISSFYPKWNHRLVSNLLVRWELDSEATSARLSAGQKQKLSLILAMGHEPELLVLDEPAASLDPQARREFLSTVIEIASDESRSVLFSTHLTSDLERVASEIAILKSGVLIYSGSMDALRESVKTLKLTSRSRLPDQIDVPGMMRCEKDTNEALLTIRGVDADLIRELEMIYNAEVEVRDLNLEDIFIEMHRD